VYLQDYIAVKVKVPMFINDMKSIKIEVVFA
jgi:hypothetical protein